MNFNTQTKEDKHSYFLIIKIKKIKKELYTIIKKLKYRDINIIFSYYK